MNYISGQKIYVVIIQIYPGIFDSFPPQLIQLGILNPLDTLKYLPNRINKVMITVFIRSQNNKIFLLKYI